MLIAGVDEAGRGPIAGDVFAAAVVLDPDRPIRGLADSKKLSAKRRGELESEIKRCALGWNVEQVDVEEIDRINILRAALLAMRKAVAGLEFQASLVRVDGCHSIDVDCPCQAVVGGDGLHEEISAASILAKEARDRYMLELGRRFPGYGFERHKGYPTPYHLSVLETLGITEIHRRSFGPVRAIIDR
ncbi:MAG: ribonuclease HII [Gammaproteobacteria bacterium]|nr:ribonuclease HII [Gammaproteobacteria bacterium]MYD76252.1 ribonuclease HII [Gammaproteobacteria bacterium]MYJ52589.1 ribonuclease HII [Gammaproteobacteria bacterium]